MCRVFTYRLCFNTPGFDDDLVWWLPLLSLCWVHFSPLCLFCAERQQPGWTRRTDLSHQEPRAGEPQLTQRWVCFLCESDIGRLFFYIIIIKQCEKVLENQIKMSRVSVPAVVENLRAALSKLECRVAVLEKTPAAVTPSSAPSVPYTNVRFCIERLQTCILVSFWGQNVNNV